MDKKITVLVFPCGAENAVEIYNALKDVVNIDLIGASGRDDHGSYLFKNYIGDIPYITENSFVESLNAVIDRNHVDIIIPTHDDVVLKLARESNRIHAKIAVPGLEQAQTCRSKKETYSLLKNYSFCPKVFSTLESAYNSLPVFAKPDTGQGGKGCFLISEKNYSKIDESQINNFVLCEFLPGEEVTVDCFTDKYGKVRFIGPRTRDRVFCGISVRSSTIGLNREIEEAAKAISEVVGMNGLWYFQLKKDAMGKYKLMEVSVRTAGTMNLYRGLGINFPLLTIYNLLGYDVEILKNDYFLQVDRALVNCYRADLVYNTIYIDFDDTITTKEGKVNPEVMLFLYSAKANDKRIKLMTKHNADLNETFDRLAIHRGLFDEIIHLKENEEKYLYITNPHTGVFIDNSFRERMSVKKNTEMPVFDVDAIPTLIDWKR